MRRNISDEKRARLREGSPATSALVTAALEGDDTHPSSSDCLMGHVHLVAHPVGHHESEIPLRVFAWKRWKRLGRAERT